MSDNVKLIFTQGNAPGIITIRKEFIERENMPAPIAHLEKIPTKRKTYLFQYVGSQGDGETTAELDVELDEILKKLEPDAINYLQEKLKTSEGVQSVIIPCIDGKLSMPDKLFDNPQNTLKAPNQVNQNPVHLKKNEKSIRKLAYHTYLIENKKTGELFIKQEFLKNPAYFLPAYHHWYRTKYAHGLSFTMESGRHPNLTMPLAASLHTNGDISIEYEFGSAGALTTALHWENNLEREKMIQLIVRQVVEGLSYRHIVHNVLPAYLTTNDIFLNLDGCVKLGAYYDSVELIKETKNVVTEIEDIKQAGLDRYELSCFTPPELFQQQEGRQILNWDAMYDKNNVDEKRAVWFIGVTILSILLSRSFVPPKFSPVLDVNLDQYRKERDDYQKTKDEFNKIMRLINSDNEEEMNQLRRLISLQPSTHQLLKKCLSSSPEKRASLSEIRQLLANHSMTNDEGQFKKWQDDIQTIFSPNEFKIDEGDSTNPLNYLKIHGQIRNHLDKLYERKLKDLATITQMTKTVERSTQKYVRGLEARDWIELIPFTHSITLLRKLNKEIQPSSDITKKANLQSRLNMIAEHFNTSVKKQMDMLESGSDEKSNFPSEDLAELITQLEQDEYHVLSKDELDKIQKLYREGFKRFKNLEEWLKKSKKIPPSPPAASHPPHAQPEQQANASATQQALFSHSGKNGKSTINNDDDEEEEQGREKRLT